MILPSFRYAHPSTYVTIYGRASHAAPAVIATPFFGY